MEPTLPQTLIFVRHAIALPASEFDGPDADRPLIAKGVSKGTAVMAKLATLYRPTRVISSPYLRARATAELLLAALPRPRPELELCEALTPTATVESWCCEIARLEFKQEDIVVLFGHEPSLGRLFAAHLGLQRPIAFKKAGVGILAPATLASASLLAFVPPKAFLARP